VIQCDIHGANGLAFSDKRWMYTSDTPNAVIYRTLDEQGEPGKRESFPFQPGEDPDGRPMDVEGCYWSAMFDGWRIARFSPRVSSWKSIDAGALPDDGLLWRMRI
jgi:sugar lactone lactonase YvrE